MYVADVCMRSEPYLEKPVLHATFLVSKHTVVPLDLVAVDTCTGKRLYSFIFVAWGIIADVDVESERFRCLGKSRYTVGAAIRIAGSFPSCISTFTADWMLFLKSPEFPRVRPVMDLGQPPLVCMEKSALN